MRVRMRVERRARKITVISGAPTTLGVDVGDHALIDPTLRARSRFGAP